jgi:PIN domain nuclease of toxin-antitoxin system
LTSSCGPEGSRGLLSSARPVGRRETTEAVRLFRGEGRAGVRPEAVDLMERAGEESFLRVSVISAWEVSMLEARGRLRFDIPCEEWVAQAFSLPGLSLMPLTPSICVRSSRLPGVFPGDPADRLIVATARELDYRRVITSPACVSSHFSSFPAIPSCRSGLCRTALPRPRAGSPPRHSSPGGWPPRRTWSCRRRSRCSG